MKTRVQFLVLILVLPIGTTLTAQDVVPGRIPVYEVPYEYPSVDGIKTYLKDKNKDYLELIHITADYISNKQFRLDDGTLARHRPQYQ